MVILACVHAIVGQFSLFLALLLLAKFDVPVGRLCDVLDRLFGRGRHRASFASKENYSFVYLSDLQYFETQIQFVLRQKKITRVSVTFSTLRDPVFRYFN